MGGPGTNARRNEPERSPRLRRLAGGGDRRSPARHPDASTPRFGPAAGGAPGGSPGDPGKRSAGGDLSRTERAAPGEACDLCREPLGPRHGHLLDLEERRLLCACRACSILFDREAAGGEHYQQVPDHLRVLEDFSLDDATWDRLRVPVGLAFFFHSTARDRVVAFYPGPAGATESLLELEAWEEMAERNPALKTLEPDVEALLVNRAWGASDHFLAPVDTCYRLAGLIRTHWKGLAGGSEVRAAVGEFFDDLRERAEPVTGQGAG